MGEDIVKIINKRDSIVFRSTFLYDAMLFLGKAEEAETVLLCEAFYSLICASNDIEIIRNSLANVITVTELLRKKISNCSELEKKIHYEELYKMYIIPINANFANGDFDLAKAFFNVMMEKAKMMSGYYGYIEEDNSYEAFVKKYSMEV